MSGSNSAISRRRLLKGAGAMWLLSVSQVGLAATSQVVAVRVWPSSTYTRVTVESNRVLKSSNLPSAILNVWWLISKV